MGNCAFGWTNRVLTGAISASAEVSALSASQVQNDHGATSKSWQTPVGTTSAWLQLDAGSAVTWDAVSLHNTNLTAAATVRFRLGDAADFAASTYDSTALAGLVVAGYRQAVHVLASTVTARYLRVDIADAANPENVLRVGQMFAGPLVRPTYNLGFRSAFERRAQAPAPRSRGGQEFPELHHVLRLWQVVLDTLDPDEALDLVAEMQRAAEPGRNVLFIPFPEGAAVAREAVFGRLVEGSAIGWPQQAQFYRAWAATITERL